MAGYNLFFGVVSLGLMLMTHPARGAKSTAELYNTSKAMLQVSRPIYLELYDIPDKQEVTTENFTLRQSDAKYMDTSNSTSIELKITYTPPADFQSAVLTLTMVYNKKRIPGYWEWSKLAVELVRLTEPTPITTSLIVAPVPGHTLHTPADINCQRDYTVCAPKGLSWTCDDEVFKDSKNASKNLLKIKFPGLKLQPFFDSNGTEIARFGFNWDCDPIISSVLWVSLLIPLFLLFGIYWALDMLSSVYTPDKFDDPKGKQIMVPTTE